MKTKPYLFVIAYALAQQPEPTIRVNVNLIQVDATVTDRSGKHVPDLKATDFEVFREGKRQEIKNVLWVPGQRTAPNGAPAVPSPKSSDSGAGSLKPQDVRRTVAIMLDDLSLSPASVHVTRDALKKFVEENVESRDLVAIYRTSSALGMMQQFSANKPQLLASIERMRFGSLKAFDPFSPISISPLESSSDPSIAQQAIEAAMREDVIQRDMQDQRTAAMLGTVNLAARGLKELPGRKSMVLVSESIQLFDLPQGFYNPSLASQRPDAQGGKRYRTEAAVRSLIDVANRSGVMIYTIDPRGLTNPMLTAQDDLGGAANVQRMNGLVNQRQSDFSLSQDGMKDLAQETGGIFYGNNNDVAGMLRGALEDQEGYYLIAFQPDDETFEKAKGTPKFQKLTVKVKRSGTTVRYRHGFFNSPDAEATAVTPLVSAVFSPFRTADVPVKLTAIFMLGEGGAPFLRTLLHIDAANLHFTEAPADAADKNQNPWQQAVLNEVVLLFDENGRIVDRVASPQAIKARGEHLTQLKRYGIEQELDIPLTRSGPYQVRAAVLDVNAKLTGSAAQFIDVPDTKQNRLALSSVVVSSAAYAEKKDPAGHPSLRILRPGGEFDYAAFIYNVAVTKEDPRPNLITQLRIFRDDKLIFTGKKNPMRPENVKDRQNLTLRGRMRINDPGEYILEVAVQDLAAPAKRQYAIRTIDFTVRPSE